MQSIATLVQNDPYLKQSRSDRIAGRKARRAKLAEAKPLPPRQDATRPFSPSTGAAANTVIEHVPEPIEQWTERQKQIHPPFKEPWFQIVDDLGPVKRTVPTVEDIQKATCEFLKVTREDILSERRTAQIVNARHIAVYLARRLTSRSMPDIGRRFGGLDHSSIWYATRKVQAHINADSYFAAEIAAIRNSL